MTLLQLLINRLAALVQTRQVWTWNDYLGLTGNSVEANVISDTGVNAANIAGEAAAPGIASLDTGAGTAGGSGRRVGASGAAFLLLGGGWYRFQSRVRVSDLSDGTDTFIALSGLTDIDAANDQTANGVYFRYTHSESGGDWTCVARDNSVESTVDSGVPVVADTFASLEIYVDAAAANARYYINGALVGTISANIPTATGRELNLIPANIKKSAGTNARQIQVDYWNLFGSLSTER